MSSMKDGYDRTIDVREIDGEPFGEIMSALEKLDAGETLRLVSSFEPVPLYDVLSKRGFDHDTEQLSEEEYHVLISETS